MQAALEALGQEIDASPRLVIRTGELNDDAKRRIEQLCADAGFSGVVAFREDPPCRPPPSSWNGPTAAPPSIPPKPSPAWARH